MFRRPLAYRAVTAGSGRTKIRQNLPAVASLSKSLGKSRCDVRNMSTVAPTIERIATVGKIEAELWQNPPNLDNQFLHRCILYSTEYRLKTTEKRVRELRPELLLHGLISTTIS
jgi:hypothetical protein